MWSHRKAPVSSEGQGWQRVASRKCHHAAVHSQLTGCHLSPALKDGRCCGNQRIFCTKGNKYRWFLMAGMRREMNSRLRWKLQLILFYYHPHACQNYFPLTHKIVLINCRCIHNLMIYLLPSGFVWKLLERWFSGFNWNCYDQLQANESTLPFILLLLCWT